MPIACSGSADEGSPRFRLVSSAATTMRVYGQPRTAGVWVHSIADGTETFLASRSPGDDRHVGVVVDPVGDHRVHRWVAISLRKRRGRGIGSCLVYAIYHSPFAFIRTLLEIGADPRAPADDGFPPLIAALSCTRAQPGTTPRADVDEVLRVLLSFGADANERGINDYTPLHMAVAERNLLAVQILLEAGADADLRTRIDDCDTPLEMAQAAGLTDIAERLARAAASGRP